MALMDAGVPLRAPVAGIAMGLITDADSDRYAILSDIQGIEDFLGDMDFKVAGTEKGINALQMDVKIDGLTQELLSEALEQARVGRLHILNRMSEAITEPRAQMSRYAPKLVKMQIPVEKIGALIGPGGRRHPRHPRGDRLRHRRFRRRRRGHLFQRPDHDRSWPAAAWTA